MVPGVDNAGIVMQGALESSNVSVMNEMTDLIKAQRAYEMNSKVMGVADQMLQTVNNVR
jgi:flagellar basal-body rod protein FlgG